MKKIVTHNPIKLLPIALAIVGLLTLLPNQAVMAVATNPSKTGQALEIAPPVLNIKADPGEVVKASISLRDVSTSQLIVRNQINDFVAAGEDGTPKILLEDSKEMSPYSLKNWIQALPEFTLKPKEITKLPITIRVPADAAPGGYYAVVRFTASPPGLDSTGVSLSASLGTLILLRVNGDAKEEVKVQEFSASTNGKANWLFESAPITFITRLKNTGNLHEQPNGQIAVKDMFGNAVANVNVNLNRNNILPRSTRKFDPKLDEGVIGNRILFGRYTADIKLSYGNNGQTITASTSFWVIPYKMIGLTIILLIVAFVAIRIGLRRYNERVITKSRTTRRRR